MEAGQRQGDSRLLGVKSWGCQAQHAFALMPDAPLLACRGGHQHGCGGGQAQGTRAGHHQHVDGQLQAEQQRSLCAHGLHRICSRRQARQEERSLTGRATLHRRGHLGKTKLHVNLSRQAPVTFPYSMQAYLAPVGRCWCPPATRSQRWRRWLP